MVNKNSVLNKISKIKEDKELSIETDIRKLIFFIERHIKKEENQEIINSINQDLQLYFNKNFLKQEQFNLRNFLENIITKHHISNQISNLNKNEARLKEKMKIEGRKGELLNRINELFNPAINPIIGYFEQKKFSEVAEIKKKLINGLNEIKTEEDIKEIVKKIDYFEIIIKKLKENNTSEGLEKLLKNNKNLNSWINKKTGRIVNFEEGAEIIERELSFKSKYSFDPIYQDNGESVLNDILYVYKTKLKNKNFSVPQRDINRTSPKYIEFLKFFKINENEARKIADESLRVISDYAEKGLEYYLQFYDIFYSVSLILANGNLNNAFYIYEQTYPYYVFIHDHRFLQNINFPEYFKSINYGFDYFLQKKDEKAFNIILLRNAQSPLSMKILEHNLLKDYKNDPETISKLKTIFYYSDYGNPEVKKLIEENGISFLAFSIYLPNLLFYEDYINEKVKVKGFFSKKIFIISNSETIQRVGGSSELILKHLMKQPEEHIKWRYNRLKDAFFENYKKVIINFSNINSNKEINDKIKDIFTKPVFLSTKHKLFNKLEKEFKESNRVYYNSVVKSLNKIKNKENIKSFNSSLGNKNKIRNLIEKLEEKQYELVGKENSDLLFKPLIEGNKSLYELIRELFKNNIIGESKIEVYEQMRKDFEHRTISRFKKLYGNKNAEAIMNKFIDVPKKYFQDGLKTFGQNWFIPLSISYVITYNDNQENLKVFSELYPFYSFFTIEEFYTISPYNFIKDKNKNKFPNINYDQFKNTSNEKKTANYELVERKKLFLSPASTLFAFLLDIPKNNNNDIEQLKKIFYFSDFTNDEVKDLCKRYGLIFLYFSYHLPDLLCIEEFMGKNSINDEEYSKIVNRKIVYEFVSGRVNLIEDYRNIIKKYLNSYIDWAKKLFSNNEVYTNKNLVKAKERSCKNFNLNKLEELNKKINDYLENKSLEQFEISSQNKTEIDKCVYNSQKYSGINKYAPNKGKNRDIQIITNINSKFSEILFSPMSY